MNLSQKYTINNHDLKSIGITLLMVAGSAIVAQLLVIIPFIDFGKNTAVITLLLITVLKLVQKYLAGAEPINNISTDVQPESATTKSSKN